MKEELQLKSHQLFSKKFPRRKLTLRIVEAWRRGDDARRKVLRALSHPSNTQNALMNSIAKQTNKEEHFTL
jgi:seryl-tRNA synthetase